MRWHVFGVHVLHEFPKGTKCHACMCDRDMTLIELILMYCFGMYVCMYSPKWKIKRLLIRVRVCVCVNNV